LRIEFSGSQITLFENEVQHLMVVDDTYQIGQFGLRTWYTSARFEIVQALKMRPRAFLIMPFKSAFNFVHSVIEDSMVNFGLDCDRADQFAISRPVMEDVKKSIAEADLVIVDFTGKNPNVYYEAGLADAMRNDWIVLAQSNRGPELRRSSYPMHTVFERDGCRPKASDRSRQRPRRSGLRKLKTRQDSRRDRDF
jgi:hypothetical protein